MFRFITKLPTKVLNLFKIRQCYYETYTDVLKNGVRIAVEATDSPVACVSLVIKTGSRFETPENNGISHFIEHMAFKGFKSMKMCELESCLNCMGAKLDAFTTREFQLFSGLCTAENTLELISILSRIITDLDLSDDDIHVGKNNILGDLNDCENSPKHVVFDYLHQAAFQGTPLAKRVIGPISNIERFDEDEANCFIRQQYHPENTVLAISGSVNRFDILSTARKWLTHIPTNLNENDTSNVQRYTGSSMIYRDDSMPFAHVAIALEVPGFGDPDFWPLFVANCLIDDWDKSQGWNETHASEVARAAAAGHLCELYESFYIRYRDTGLWGVYCVAQKEKLEDFLICLQHQWMLLCTSITDLEVQRGVNIAMSKLAKGVAGPVKSCHDAGLEMLYYCERTSLKTKFNDIRKVNAKAVREVGDRYIYDKCPVVAAVGPTECLSDYSLIRSRMYWLRL